LRDLLAKRQKPTEVENTTLASGSGQGFGDRNASLFFTPHPGVHLPTAVEIEEQPSS